MPRFFLDSITGEQAIITGADGAHIARSLRMGPGEALTLCDGRGTDYACVIAAVDGDQVTLRILDASPSQGEPTLEVTLYQGLPKADKLEWIIQKAVELGVVRIVPVEMRRSIVRADERAAKKRDRWQKIADEAAGQCGRGILPVVEPPIKWKEALARLETERVLTFYEGGGRPLRELVSPADRRISIVVGPEGGLAPEDVDEMTAQGAQLATLGPRILRCETAPVAALAVLMALSGNLG